MSVPIDLQLDCDLRPDLDHPPGRDLEIIGRVVGRSASAMNSWSCQCGMPDCAAGFSERRDTKNDVDMISNCQPSLRAITSACGTFGDSMKPNRSATFENLSLMFSMRTRSAGSTRGRVRGLDREDDVVFVQNLVVLEIVQERGRHEIGIAGQEHRGALDDVRRPLLEALNQILQRHFGAAGLLERECAVPRRQVQIITTIATPNNSGTQAPSSSLSRLALKKRRVDDDKRHDQRGRRRSAPTPELPDDDEAHDAVDDHRGRHRDAVGRGQAARGAEHTDQQQHADQQQVLTRGR